VHRLLPTASRHHAGASMKAFAAVARNWRTASL
jgi:hypothetical protein